MSTTDDTNAACRGSGSNDLLGQVSDARKPCTCDGAGRGPGRPCVVKAGGRLGELWRCAEGHEPPEWLHLKQYGYAPGNYMSRCHRCEKVVTGLDKRAITCLPCAQLRHAERAAAFDALKA